MTAQELKQTRKDFGFSQREMWELLQTPYRTYQSWEGGERRVPGVVSAALAFYRRLNQEAPHAPRP